MAGVPACSAGGSGGGGSGGTPAAAAPGGAQQRVAWLATSPLLREVATSGLGVACGTTLTNPIDVVKTRLQLRSASANQGMLATGASIVRGEGALALWKGWTPAVMRGLLYGGLRLGLYGPAKTAVAALGRRSSSGAGGPPSPSAAGGPPPPPPPPGLSSKVLAGIASGSVAAALLSPTELLKVRLQAPGAAHAGLLGAAGDVVRSDGVRGLWKGATPGVARAAVLTASQCATYDEVKARVMAATGWGDGAATHLATAMVTGVVSTTATNPVDVVKTHMFVGGKRHSGPFACAASIYAAHGAGGFWRGWLANYARLGPQTVVTFVVVEQLRAWLGMPPLG